MGLYAANIYFWRRYRVNHPFIFGFKQGTDLEYREVFLLSFAIAVLAIAAALANLDMEMDAKTQDYKAVTELVPVGLLCVSILNSGSFPSFPFLRPASKLISSSLCSSSSPCYSAHSIFSIDQVGSFCLYVRFTAFVLLSTR